MSGTETAFVFGVVSEADSDQQIVRGLAERVLVESIDWLESESLSGLCRWQGFGEDDAYLSWTAIERSAKSWHVVIHGRYAGRFDERRARLALLLFTSLERRPDAVILVRDTDNVTERVLSLERARDHPWAFAVVLATPHTKRECWVLNGFEPCNDLEAAALERARQRIGFDPCLAAERLTAKGKKGKNNAKVILGDDLGVRPASVREVACWQETGLEVLRARGRETFLAMFLQEVADRLVPILSGPSGG